MKNPFKMMDEWMDAKSAEFRESKESAEAEITVLKKVQSTLKEAGSGYITERPTDGGWGNPFEMDGQRGHIFVDQREMIHAARRFVRYDANGRAAIENIVKYIIGRGVTITPRSKDPRVHYVWREFWNSPRNNMPLRQFEMIRRSVRDGELLIQHFSTDGEGADTWKTTVRFRDPILLGGQNTENGKDVDNTNGGVVCDPNDIEKPLKYQFRKRPPSVEMDEISADEILHVKINADSDQRRGESYLQPVMRLLTDYSEWLKNRIILNKLRTAIYLIRKVESGGAADLDRLSQSLGQSRNARQTAPVSRQPKAGTILNASGGVSYEMINPNINAQDVKDDGRAIVTRIAGGTGQPEHNFGDASNSNFASTMVSEAPFVKEVQAWQQFFEGALWKPLFRIVIQNAVDAGKLIVPDEDDVFKLNADYQPLDEVSDPSKEKGAAADGKQKGGADDPAANDKNAKPEPSLNDDAALKPTPFEMFYECDMDWPEVVHRDQKQLVDSLVMASEKGWISDVTASATLGYDAREEMRKQQEWQDLKAAEGDPWQGNNVLDPNAVFDQQNETEMQALLKDLTPEERAQVQNMQPDEVAAFLKKRKAKTDAGNGGGNE